MVNFSSIHKLIQHGSQLGAIINMNLNEFVLSFIESFAFSSSITMDIIGYKDTRAGSWFDQSLTNLFEFAAVVTRYDWKKLHDHYTKY